MAHDGDLKPPLEGVDINDDYALAAFARHVWEQATAAFMEERVNDERVQRN